MTDDVYVTRLMWLQTPVDTQVDLPARNSCPAMTLTFPHGSRTSLTTPYMPDRR